MHVKLDKFLPLFYSREIIQINVLICLFTKLKNGEGRKDIFSDTTLYKRNVTFLFCFVFLFGFFL